MVNVAASSRLPVEVSSFVGRQSDVAEITRLLFEARVVTLTGIGGVGKSRLAVRVGRSRQRAFDGVWLVELVELAELQRPALLAQTIVGVLQIQDRRFRPAEDVLVEYLSVKRVLLILDNCEHLLDACASLATVLVRAAPAVRILATSLEPLGIAAEQTYAVSPLPLPLPLPGTRGHRRTAGPPSVKLFVDALTVATRTAECHVQNILTKLGFTNRWQVARWLEQ